MNSLNTKNYINRISIYFYFDRLSFTISSYYISTSLFVSISNLC